MATSTLSHEYDKNAATAIPLGTVHGGVWLNEQIYPPCFGATCPACDWWQTFYTTPEAADGALGRHQRHDCPARVDGRMVVKEAEK